MRKLILMTEKQAETYKKICSVIESCISIKQLESCINIIENYKNMYNCNISYTELRKKALTKTVYQ